jgi:endonuclease YncB( thermonuclease family)
VLPQKLLAYEPQVFECALAYIKVPRIGRPFGKSAAQILQDTCMEKTSDAIIVSQGQYKTELVLFEEGEKDWNNSLNARLVDKAYAALKVDRKQAPQEVLEWFDWEEQAKEEQINIWEYGEVDDDE